MAINVRYEVSKRWPLPLITQPFEIGVRHLEVAFCDGSQASLIRLAKERVIYRPRSHEDAYNALSLKDRVVHYTIGLLETVGYTIPIIPFVAFTADIAVHRFLCSPWIPPRAYASYGFFIHMEEGGNFEKGEKIDNARESETSRELRRNPFHVNAMLDPFYEGASWARSHPKEKPATSEGYLRSESTA